MPEPCPNYEDSAGVAVAEPQHARVVARAVRTPAPLRPLHYDPDFRKAVEKGMLTEAQAYARGKREIYAHTLAIQHGFGLKVAYAITDNRVTFATAMKVKQARRQRMLRDSREPTLAESWLEMLATAVSAVLMIMLLSLRAGDDGRTHRPSPVQQGRPDGQQVGLFHEDGVMWDGRGQVLRVIADEPDDVMYNYCEGVGGAHLRPMGILPPESASSPVRIGVIRDKRDPEHLRAIVIHADPKTGRWFAGNGLGPIELTGATADALHRLSTR